MEKNEAKTLVFKCAQCGHTRLEVIFDGIHSCELTRVDPEGDHDTGEIQSEAMVERIQCLECGYILEDECGPIIYDDIVDWLTDHIPQE